MKENKSWLSRWMIHTWKVHPVLAQILVKRKVFTYLIYIFPGLLVYYLLPILEIIEGKTMLEITRRLCMVYVISCILLVLNSLLLLFLDIYNTKDKMRSRPMKGLVQVFQVLLFFIGGIIIISVLINQSPTTLFAGLGASAAVLMLVFKDSILGFVAGVQLSANDMVRIGDWIQLPDGSANGIVQEITLNTVKIKNWDNTISTVPPYTLVNTTFRNWRGMQESGGRRVNKTIKLDMSTLKFCTSEMMNHIRQEIPLMDNIGQTDSDMPTNVQLYRIYIERYLRSHPIVNANLDLIISQKEPTEYGLPIEVYFFLSDKVWNEFEQIQSDIFDHLLVMVKEFDLALYQYS
ncbi:MAG: mechanosensitive ion channel [Bacteroidaceae bacterium]|nr:mechanosensitive ion channel [Bacteroidaceae bacterium]MBR5613027.1 mechanosensitive ion channel [Bacteroidaceae bacterium]